MSTRRQFIVSGSVLAGLGLASGRGFDARAAAPEAGSGPWVRSVRDFGVEPTRSAAGNRDRLQEAIDWAHPRGAALVFEPSEDPYPLAGGLTVRRNVSLLGVHGPVGRGSSHPDRSQPVGSVLAIEDEDRPLFTVEGATQLRGLQFWYPRQTLSDPDAIIAYPATIAASHQSPAQGVTLANLTFFGEYAAMDFRVPAGRACEQVLVEHCYGYPLSGRFVMIDHCYDIPRLLHCHVNPANRRFIDGGYSVGVIDAVVAKETYAYWIDHTDNAQMIDTFTFGTYGGAYLGPATYGQMTNFNYDCVTVGIHKTGDNDKNRNWQIAQGSIIANTGPAPEQVHPIVIAGRGHTSLSNVEAFSGGNPALSNFGASHDVIHIRGNEPLSASLFGCRMHGYTAEEPITLDNDHAALQAAACFDAKRGRLLNFSRSGAA